MEGVRGHISVFTGGCKIRGEAEQLVGSSQWPNHTITCSVVKRRDHTRRSEAEASIVGFVSREII